MLPTLSEFKKLQTEQERVVNEFAKRVRRELIIPVCQKHDLEFLSKMGTYFFRKNEKHIGGSASIYESNDEKTQRRYGLTKIVELLEQQVGSGSNHDLGMYCADVRRGVDYQPGAPLKRRARRRS